MLNHFKISNCTRRQSGVSLIIALIFLVVLTLFATAGVRTTLLQERMAGNSMDMNLSFQAAELAVRQAEIRAGGGLVMTQFNSLCSNGLCSFLNAPYWANTSTWADGLGEKYARVNVASTALANINPPLAADPKYMIEYLGAINMSGESENSTEAYRVFAHALGTNEKTETNVMTTYVVPSL